MNEKNSCFGQSRRQFLSKILHASTLFCLGCINLPSYVKAEEEVRLQMDYRKILSFIAPCGLNCRKCFAYTKGDIGFHSKKLQELLGNFDSYAEWFSTHWPEFKGFMQFKKILTTFAAPDCKGCRQGFCKHPNCGVIDCYKEKGVDFCFQCDDFPCDKTKFDSYMEKRWLQMNTRMKEIGVEAYFEETKDISRYL